MKNLFKFLMAAAVLFGAASCAKEDISSSIAGNGEAVEVTFSANLADLGTRANEYGSGAHANTLQFFVYQYADKNSVGHFLPDVLVYTGDQGSNVITKTSGNKFNFSLTLVKGMKYNILFWADKGDGSLYEVVKDNNNVPTGVIKANYDGVLANNESLDAFFGSLKNFDPAIAEDQQRAKDIKLSRPFAQLNAYTNDLAIVEQSDKELDKSSLAVNTYTTLDLFSGDVDDAQDVTFNLAGIPAGENHISMNYLLAPAEKCTANVTFDYTFTDPTIDFPAATYTYVPLQRNYRTNILGALLTKPTEFNVEIKPGFEAEYGVEEDVVSATVNNVEQFATALADDDIDTIVLGDDINLNDLLTRAEADPSYTVKAGKTLTIDLNGKKLSATSTQTGKNYNMFNVKGSLTVNNGTIEYKHEGENMGWNSSTNIFDVTAGGVLNLNGVTAKNLGGSDMGFVAHLNNWGEVTLNVENSTLESNYVPVRVFNSGPDMNNVTIKNSTLNGVSAAFWVHNYTAVDFGSEAKAEAQKALLNFNIYNQGNTFSPDINGIRYGFTNSIRTDAYGITKTVSEDGTEVTLGSIIENGLIRRGVAGEEENTTIKKAIVGEGVTTLYDRTFRRFYALETVVLPSTLTTIGAAGSGVFQSCNNLKNIVLPESVTVLGEGTFQECTSLKSINIPAGVTRIEKNVFRNTGLTSVEFHAGVTYFGNYAFRDCEELTEIIINAPSFTVESDTFLNAAGPFPAYVIKVANAEMKAYLESRLSAHQKTFITVVIKGTVIVSNAVEFISAVNNVEEGGTILVDESFNFTTEEGGRTDNGGWWDGLGYSGDKSFTIDLNGKTIGDANGALNDYLFWFKNDGEKANTITIKNGTLDAGTKAYCALCTASSNKQTLTINVENVNLINEKSDGSTVKVRGGSIVNIKAGTKITGKDSYLGIENWKATVNIYDGAEIYMNGTTSYNGCLVGVGGNGIINVYGGYGKGVSGGLIAMTSGGTINVAGGEWIANADGTYANSNKSVLIAQSDKQYNAGAGNAVVNVTGGTFKGGYNCYGNAVGDAQINIAGGNFNNNPTSYVVEGKTATEANGIWTVQ